MSEIFRLIGFFIIAVLAYGATTSDTNVDKTRFLVMAILGVLMVMIGYLGDIVDAIKENTAAKTKVDVQKP